MTTFRNNIGPFEDCYMGLPVAKVSEFLDLNQEDYFSFSRPCNKITDLNPKSWSFSPLPSPESPYLESPVLSGTFRDATWDPLEQSFGSILTPDSTDDGFFPSDSQFRALPSPEPGDRQKVQPGYVAPAVVECLPIDRRCIEIFPSTGSPQLGSPMQQKSYSAPQTIRQPNWGRSNPSHHKISARPSRASKHTVSYDETTPTATTTPPKRSPEKRLRSTSSAIASSTTPRVLIPSTSSSCNSPPRQTRLNHNQVEKQYRNRLNGHFEGLLLVLPREAVAGRGGEKKVSKAEVLSLARKHIKELERQRDRLQDENTRLGEAMLELRRGWMESGGVVALP
ncbi:helix-loop-helix DNA-binding domain containing protein [Drepanopeziza brunnea f. sp. 'multigermtubi' MB_m1]|uniref:Helix-loop-helix DNA-binding domain containing protein n=1 Tax=Marssonina brunnea f. sp. multigermtubi (strain MB_m1) TaxID=1072389 RepID=K1X3S9_MARBU|nr:helix-loop-helix DNA-binding domain containing protein [Drepanopeziza brunnea f. sp. 'multigermtubi' MB_m1]EKD19637.1 helix-loop-helix DNA-binding domain containing protein [Drepanopeziza brunnea f. sp. 'multigermtubi' MB_m1]